MAKNKHEFLMKGILSSITSGYFPPALLPIAFCMLNGAVPSEQDNFLKQKQRSGGNNHSYKPNRSLTRD
jgi:hypothetical protein